MSTPPRNIPISGGGELGHVMLGDKQRDENGGGGRRRGSNTMAKGEREWDSRNPPAQTRVTAAAAEPPSPVKEVRKYCGFPHRHHFLMQRWTCRSNFNDNFATTLQLHVLIVKTRAAASNFLFVWVVSCISDV